jgi:hypothetical protein
MLNLGVFLLFAGSLAVFLLHTVVAFSHLLVPIPNYFGNARSPYSDALAPWTQGTVSYYVFDLPAHFLYRPTAGLFFSPSLQFRNFSSPFSSARWAGSSWADPFAPE